MDTSFVHLPQGNHRDSGPGLIQHLEQALATSHDSYESFAPTSGDILATMKTCLSRSLSTASSTYNSPMSHQSSRQTRSQSRQRDAVTDNGDTTEPTQPTIPGVAVTANPQSGVLTSHVRNLPARLTTSATGLRSRDLKLLSAKREKLRAPDAQLRSFIHTLGPQSKRYLHPDQLTSSIRATFVFAQEEAGTAVCVSPLGQLLTCAHCVAEDDEEAIGKHMWLIGAEGRVVRAQCTAWDERRDLALLQITDAEDSIAGADISWPHAQLAISMSQVGRNLICVGHPGSEDFEASTPGQATGYDVLHISEGRYRGLAPDQDVHDNSETGALMHDCWTYWGHSGAPLIEVSSGCLVGLHSSWDDQTGMRRGVALAAIRAFTRECVHMRTAAEGDKASSNLVVGSKEMTILLE